MLINCHEDLKHYVEINSNIYFPSIKPSIQLAEQAHILPVIGAELYNELLSEYTNDSLTPLNRKVLTALQKALASLAMANYIPIAAVQVSDAGITNANSGDGKAAFKYQEQNIESSLLNRGLIFLEEFIKVLELNKATLPLWTASEEFKKYRSSLILTGNEFAEYYTNTKHPRQLFMQLRGALYQVEQLAIKPTISTEIFDAIKLKLQDATPSLTAEEIILIGYAKRALVFLALFQGIPHINVSIDSNGISVLSMIIDNNAANSNRTIASDNHLSMLMRTCEEHGNRWLGECTAYLNSVASDSVFPTWYATMQAEATTTKDTDINETKRSLFSM